MIGCFAGFCSNKFLKYGEQAHKIILWAFVCWPWTATHYITPFLQNTNHQMENTSVAIVTSQKLFSSLRCLKEATMFVWKSFQRRQNCWSSAMVDWDFLNQIDISAIRTNIYSLGMELREHHVCPVYDSSTQIVMKILLHFKTDRLEGRKVNSYERHSNMHICGTGYMSLAQFCQPSFSGEGTKLLNLVLAMSTRMDIQIPGKIYRYTTFYMFICWLQVSGT